jgi:hypothetical protein
MLATKTYLVVYRSDPSISAQFSFKRFWACDEKDALRQFKIMDESNKRANGRPADMVTVWAETSLNEPESSREDGQ